MVYAFLGGLIGASPLLIAETDLGESVLAVSGLLLVNAAIRTAWAFRSMRSRKMVDAATVSPAKLQEAAS